MVSPPKEEEESVPGSNAIDIKSSPSTSPTTSGLAEKSAVVKPEGESKPTKEVSKPKANRRRLDALQGARFLASLWVVSRHIADFESKNIFQVASSRAFIPVIFFAVLTGFITHYAYASRPLFTNRGAVLQYYARRILRVAIMGWISLSLCIAIDMYQRGFKSAMTWLNLRCYLMIEPWGLVFWNKDFNFCTNTTYWTICSFIPGWLCYPFTQQFIGKIEEVGGMKGLCGALVLVWGIFLSAVGIGLATTNFDEFAIIYMWPPFMMIDFNIGAIAAAMAHHTMSEEEASKSEKIPLLSNKGEQEPLIVDVNPTQYVRGWMADLCVIFVIAITFDPANVSHEGKMNGKVHRGGEEVFKTHGIAIVFAFFMYLYACGCDSWSTAILSHPSIASLGDYSFAVYLLQAAVIDTANAVGYHYMPGNYVQTASNSGTLGLVLIIYFVAALYQKFVDAPIASMIQKWSADWFDAKKV